MKRYILYKRSSTSYVLLDTFLAKRTGGYWHLEKVLTAKFVYNVHENETGISSSILFNKPHNGVILLESDSIPTIDSHPELFI